MCQSLSIIELIVLNSFSTSKTISIEFKNSGTKLNVICGNLMALLNLIFLYFWRNVSIDLTTKRLNHNWSNLNNLLKNIWTSYLVQPLNLSQTLKVTRENFYETQLIPYVWVGSVCLGGNWTPIERIFLSRIFSRSERKTPNWLIAIPILTLIF